MNNYYMKVVYEGTRYDGWQRQKNSKNTIQGKLEYCLSEILQENIEINGSGRTDSGVHAKGQIANFKTNSSLSPNEIRFQLSKLLPEDIAVSELKKTDERFHARLHAKGKLYQYRIYLDHASPVFERKFMFHHPEPLDITSIKTVSNSLIGTHDFALFNDNKRFKKSTVRTIHSIEIEQSGYELIINFSGDGFMYHMIRRLMGLLIYTGETGVITDTIFSLKDWPKKWPLTPAKGLTLLKVLY